MNAGTYVAAFFGGLFLANFVPHFVKGVCGDAFPTPFAKPPGKGLSSPRLNVVWGLANFVAAYFLLHRGGVGTGSLAADGACFLGVALLSVTMAPHFAKKDKA